MGNYKNIKSLIIKNIAWFGIQIGFTLQLANISIIYGYFGAKTAQIPILFLAFPLGGLLIPPLVGIVSDRTNGRFGRRKPYILIGMLVSAMALFLIPRCSMLWEIVLLACAFSFAINMAMVPLRAFTTDGLSNEQMTLGFSVQGIIIALGSIISACFPWLLTNIFKIGAKRTNIIPEFVTISFTVGAVAMVITAILTTAYSKDLKISKDFVHPEKSNNIFLEMLKDITKMPKEMVNLSIIQFFAWLGLMGIFMYFPVMINENIFKNSSGITGHDLGIQWTGICFAVYAIIQFIVSFLIPYISRKITEKYTLLLTLLCGGIGAMSVYFFNTQYGVIWAMIGIGIMIAGLNILPFSILSQIISHDKTAAYMGILNIFISLPGTLLSFVFGPIIHYFYFDDSLYGVVLSGAFILIAAAVGIRVKIKNVP